MDRPFSMRETPCIRFGGTTLPMSAHPRMVFRASPSGLLIVVRVTPRASRTTLKGVIELPSGPALALAVAAPPVDGAANQAVVEFIAKALGVRRSDVSIEGGDSGRLKTIHVRGDVEQLRERCAALL